MPVVPLKKLYKATSVERLNKFSNISDAVKGENPRKLLKSAGKILSSAELSDADKDEELAYINYMKYFSVIQIIQSHDEYKKDKKFFDSLIDTKNVKKAILRAEELSLSLQQRYDHLSEANNAQKKEITWKRKEIEEKKEKDVKKMSIANMRKDLSEDGFITCNKLVSLIKEKSSSFLVVDVRPSHDFEETSMKISTLINIPENVLKLGLTADKAGRELSESGRLLWGRRHVFDYIIICDWFTEEKPLPPHIKILIEAMEKWDPGKKYRSSPSVLKGGYDMFSYSYPMLISNPRSLDPISRKSRRNISLNSLPSDGSNLNFAFPQLELDTGFIATPSPDKRPLNLSSMEAVDPPSVNRNVKPKISGSPFNSKNGNPLDFMNEVKNQFSDILNNGRIFSGSTTSIASSADENASSLLSEGLNTSYSKSGSPILDQNESKNFATDFDRARSSVLTHTIKDQFPIPSVPNRALKPQDLLDSLKAKKKDLDEEQLVLEQSYIAEKDALEKLNEMQENKRLQLATDNKDMQIHFAEKEKKLKEDLANKKKDMQAMEQKYDALHQQNEEMRNLLSQLLSGQVKLDSLMSSVTMNADQKEEKEALRISEERRRQLYSEVEQMRKKRKQKEIELKEEKRARERETANIQDVEEKIGQLQLNNERTSRNRENIPPDIPTVSTQYKKIGGETYTTTLKTSPRSSPVRGGSNMKRSHSALNLSQLKDEGGFESPMPNFDRSLKPLNSPRRRNINAARQRNFEPKFGSVAPTKTGLKNLGNTCYMNSIIQCLSNTFPLAKYFLEGQYGEELNPKSNQKGEVAEEFGAVVRALWCSQYRSIAMWDLKFVVGRYHKAFQGYDQHDSHEFLIKFMDWLHDDLNLVCVKLPKMEEQNFDNIPDYMAARTMIEALQERDESVIRNLFYGLHRSVITCHTCDNRSLTFEPFSILTLALPANGRGSLKDMLYEFYKETRIEYKCSKCRKMRICSRKFDIWTLPPVLIIHLNRFEHDVLMKKKQNFVDFPLENLNLAEHAPNTNMYTSFDLYGVSNHFGTIDGGHYTSFCKSPHKSWYKFDDHEVYDLSRESVRTSAAYILFYEASSIKSSL